MQAALGASWYRVEKDRGAYTKGCSRAYLAAFHTSRGYMYLPSKDAEYDFIKCLYLVIREPIIIYRDRGSVLLWSDEVVYKTSKMGERIDEGDYLLSLYWEGF